ncbi:uncharacterized protein LOC125068653 [Vanessa atalanta]|uniref:uncharacterized protein LOC125068653 n=1 Tax=Vanessa atalanta TaxID=42275 RepID=UPI001FCE2220|nr:uncharacterized protein LOC125068653 [Vanessa atalanta]
MKCEIPELGRCCFCFPLRLGLLVWGYGKLIASVVLVTLMLFNLINDWHRFWGTVDVVFAIVYLTFIGSVAADVIFLVLFAVSAHKKNYKIMGVFSKFCLYMLALYVLGFVLSVVYGTYESHFLSFYIGFTLATICFSCIVIQMYIVILVRSEVLKLQRGTNFEFVNHGADAIINVKMDMNAA